MKLYKEEVKVLGYSDDIGIVELNEKTGEWKKAEIERGKLAVLNFALTSQQIKWLMGEVLTVLEAVIDDERKLKATKDIIKSKFSSKLSWIYELFGMPKDSEDSSVGLEE